MLLGYCQEYASMQVWSMAECLAAAQPQRRPVTGQLRRRPTPYVSCTKVQYAIHENPHSSSSSLLVLLPLVPRHWYSIPHPNVRRTVHRLTLAHDKPRSLPPYSSHQTAPSVHHVRGIVVRYSIINILRRLASTEHLTLFQPEQRSNPDDFHQT